MNQCDVGHDTAIQANTRMVRVSSLQAEKKKTRSCCAVPVVSS